MNSHARSSGSLEEEILKEAEHLGRLLQEAAQKIDGLDREQEVAERLDGLKGMARDDWRNREYWWCETSGTVHTLRHCDQCRLMPYSQILKRMQER